MDRAFLANVAASPMALPAGLQTGYVTDQSQVTVPGPYWYHMVTEELMALIQWLGVTPSSAKTNQLSVAVGSLLTKIYNAINYSSLQSIPIGTVLPFIGSVPPNNFVLAQGSDIPYSGAGSYAQLSSYVDALASTLKTLYAADWMTRPGTFCKYTDAFSAITYIRVPDYRGLIMKGHPNGSGTFTTNPSRTFGSYEADQVIQHAHQYLDIWYREANFNGSGYPDPVGYGTGSSSTDGDNTSAQILRTSYVTGGAENTVRNTTINYIVRVASDGYSALFNLVPPV